MSKKGSIFLLLCLISMEKQKSYYSKEKGYGKYSIKMNGGFYLDIVAVLTNSPQPKTYWAKMKTEAKMSQRSHFKQLKLPAEDENCAGVLPHRRHLVSYSRSSPKLSHLNWLARFGTNAYRK